MLILHLQQSSRRVWHQVRCSVQTNKAVGAATQPICAGPLKVYVLADSLPSI